MGRVVGGREVRGWGCMEGPEHPRESSYFRGGVRLSAFE